MKAAQIKAPRSIHLIEIDDPVLTDCPTDHIIVRLQRGCLCGSDSPFFAYDLTHVRDEALEELTISTDFLEIDTEKIYPLRTGLSLHECVGTVICSASSKFKEGDFVLALPDHQNGYQENLLIPSNRAIHLPENAVSIEEMVLSQPLGTVIWACRKLENVIGSNFNDTIIMQEGSLGTVDGGAGTDTFEFAAGTNISGSTEGSDLAALFSDVEELDFSNVDISGDGTFSIGNDDIFGISGGNSMTIYVNTATIGLSDINILTQGGETVTGDSTVGSDRTITWSDGSSLTVSG